nr:porin [Cupriavidus sp. amp6]
MAGLAVSAHAQSSVTLYGLISTGVTYANNQGGKSAVILQNGPQQLPRFGMRGAEDQSIQVKPPIKSQFPPRTLDR